MWKESQSACMCVCWIKNAACTNSGEENSVFISSYVYWLILRETITRN